MLGRNSKRSIISERSVDKVIVDKGVKGFMERKD